MQTLIKGRLRIQSRIRCKIPNSEAQQSLSYCQTCLLYKIPPHLHALKSHCFKFLQFFRQIDVVRLVTSANRRKLSGYFFGIWAHSFQGSFKFYRIFSVFWLRGGNFRYFFQGTGILPDFFGILVKDRIFSVHDNKVMQQRKIPAN